MLHEGLIMAEVARRVDYHDPTDFTRSIHPPLWPEFE
jgi:hypothetical protein